MDTEYKAHERAEEFNPDFAKQHMVGLEESFDSDDAYVILYEVAGHSLDNYGHTPKEPSRGFGGHQG